MMVNYPYLVSALLFLIGCYTILSHSNLIKKIMGINIMESGIFLLFIAAGNLRGSHPPLLRDGLEGPYANPLPSALILTGIVVSVSVTSLALSLAVKLYRHYGTLDAGQIVARRSEVTKSAERQ